MVKHQKQCLASEIRENYIRPTHLGGVKQQVGAAVVSGEHVLNQDKKEKSHFVGGVKHRDCLDDYLPSPSPQKAILNHKKKR